VLPELSQFLEKGAAVKPRSETKLDSKPDWLYNSRGLRELDRRVAA
jgi:hypothetical protein